MALGLVADNTDGAMLMLLSSCFCLHLYARDVHVLLCKIPLSPRIWILQVPILFLPIAVTILRTFLSMPKGDCLFTLLKPSTLEVRGRAVLYTERVPVPPQFSVHFVTQAPQQLLWGSDPPQDQVSQEAPWETGPIPPPFSFLSSPQCLSMEDFCSCEAAAIRFNYWVYIWPWRWGFLFTQEPFTLRRSFLTIQGRAQWEPRGSYTTLPSLPAGPRFNKGPLR